MERPNRKFGVIGLGKMGGGLAAQALDKRYEVVGFDPGGISRELRDAGIIGVTSLSELTANLPAPRKILIYVPAGPVVDDVLDELSRILQPGDIIADGGNSYWGDSRRRYARLAERDIEFVDAGTSGGVDGAREGACFMVGGTDEAVSELEALFLDLSVDGGYVHAGPPGAGHFVKLVHNGIEFGMLQAIGEGVDLLMHHDQKLPIAEVLSCWTNGSVIRSWLVELMERHWREQHGLADVPPFVEDTGEVNWLVADAMRMERPVPVIAEAVMQLFTSRDDDRDWSRAIAAMRRGFGGHPFGADEAIERERTIGRVGPIYTPDDEN